MVTLGQFNQLSQADAVTLLTPCVAIPAWVSELVAGRPYARRHQLLERAQLAASRWQQAELQQALSAHPRIGEKPAGADEHHALSRQEQAGVDAANAPLAEALRHENARYEAHFGHVFLIRARGRSGEQMLQELRRRLHNSPAQETAEALAQLSEITLIRLEGVISA
ncbi:2-oxo-4-hydroxy-4-carboxy-5-ureidoimidazoline decarboxylase (plasmid) [Erwinia sp. E602]|uniref:2-oxo-4-hydroxy-4-carboxy-5-ureidoimidazoline decarboxylase n=1 Tax=Erwinia sp. E602 TaxID=2675378 RepID=UPI001BA6410E|nr:2-oxo-4-hydroxy-4-carboxy-5-ureidoimidazoline decarboxylase [Erwinia sp. E602]QUG73723.1 2-oxo-4-hydroxy-4-carboxy-5-ureidoimidazoline decarboxylase [Erwinia sp. E602]